METVVLGRRCGCQAAAFAARLHSRHWYAVSRCAAAALSRCPPWANISCQFSVQLQLPLWNHLSKSVTMVKKACSKCGSLYELTSKKVPWRDEDSVRCEVCGTILHTWNCSRTWAVKLLQRGEKANDNAGDTKL
jgi:hypothetical protein